jgi:cytoplasmic FMR1 interacting protein
LDKPYKQQLELIYSAARFHTPKSRYHVILKQRHFQLLGRSIDLNHLIGQRMNSKLRQNIDFAISRFEASDITTIIEVCQCSRPRSDDTFTHSELFANESYSWRRSSTTFG